MTVATVPLIPGPDTGPGMGESAADHELTLTWAELDRELGRADRTGLCACPVRLRGRIDAIDLATGELAPVYDTGTEPGGVLLTACGNRRETVCPACSRVYKRDARQLVRAGLTGGKGVPGTIAGHPCVFATFTAPSFGPVHSRRMRRGEVLGLRWDDIDADAQVIRVRQQIQRIQGRLHIGPVKTRAGRRDLPLIGLAKDALTARRRSSGRRLRPARPVMG